MEANLRELLERAKADVSADPTRFHAVVEAMYRAYADEVSAFVRRRVREARIDDVSGATWEAVPKALEGFKGDASFLTWLLRIAGNKTVDELRRTKDGRHEALSNIISKMAADSRQRPSRALARAEMDRLVRGIIDELDADERELILLHFEDGQSAADIARARGLIPNTVAQRLVRARTRLRKLCEAAGIGVGGLREPDGRDG